MYWEEHVQADRRVGSGLSRGREWREIKEVTRGQTDRQYVVWRLTFTLSGRRSRWRGLGRVTSDPRQMRDHSGYEVEDVRDGNKQTSWDPLTVPDKR